MFLCGCITEHPVCSTLQPWGSSLMYECSVPPTPHPQAHAWSPGIGPLSAALASSAQGLSSRPSIQNECSILQSLGRKKPAWETLQGAGGTRTLRSPWYGWEETVQACVYKEGRVSSPEKQRKRTWKRGWSHRLKAPEMEKAQTAFGLHPGVQKRPGTRSSLS